MLKRKSGGEHGSNVWSGESKAFSFTSDVSHQLPAIRTMIQVLLHMLKLTLPGPKLLREEETKKRKKKKSKDSLPVETDEERLESFMDKVAVWQLTASLDASQSASRVDGSDQSGGKSDRHWTQTFYEDIVEPLYVNSLLVNDEV